MRVGGELETGCAAGVALEGELVVGKECDVVVRVVVRVDGDFPG